MGNNKKYLYNGSYEGMTGIILESRGGTKGTKNERNSDYKSLLKLVLDTLVKGQQGNVKIFVASNNKKYEKIEDRLINIDGEFIFDFSNIDTASFLPKLNKAIKKLGQDEGVEGGNSTKRLFFTTEDFGIPFILEESEETNFPTKKDIATILQKFKFPFDRNKKLREEVKELVLELQKSLKSYLETVLKEYKWETEYTPSDNQRDSFDIFGRNEKTDHCIIIELDPHRADSVAKKFVSRMAIMIDKNITYIAFIYPGTDKMSIPETNKYIVYCQDLTKVLNNNNCKKEFMGYYL
ncbi:MULTISPECIES: hypothetical protein [Capnocytophaga]|nr:hypothetical protein [Capnocytophaga sp. FDAARGOS_737]QGS17282.1 hypothetical protein FOC45_02995 [Capnocytophaga sp. FDAARGOS_737]